MISVLNSIGANSYAARKTVVLSLLVLSACSTRPHVVKDTGVSVASAREVYVVNHSWHTGFIVPADTIQQQLPQLKDRFGDVPFIEIGWGDEEFYQADEVTSGLKVHAILWPTDTVVHAVAIPQRADKYYPPDRIESLCLDHKQYALLVSFIENSFYKDNDGKIIKLKYGIYGNSQFYKGTGSYNLINTCNKWTAKGLKSAGLDISTTFKLSADSIMDYLSEYNESATKRSCPENISQKRVN